MSPPRDPRRATYPGVKAAVRQHLTSEWQTARRLRAAIGMWAPSTIRHALYQMREAGEVDHRLVADSQVSSVNEYRAQQQED